MTPQMSVNDIDPIWLLKVKYESDVNEIKNMILAFEDWVDKTNEETANKIASLSEDEFLEFSRINVEHLGALTRRLQEPMRTEAPKVDPLVSGRVWDAVRRTESGLPRYKRWIAEMATVYLVALQEAFVEDLLQETYRMKPQLLTSKQIDAVLHGGIDGVAGYFGKRLGISLEKGFKDWQAMREISYRRNVIVHNRGYANIKYCNKTGCKESGKDLETDIPYVLAAADVISGLINFLSYQTAGL
jgi:hypothetical protein